MRRKRREGEEMKKVREGFQENNERRRRERERHTHTHTDRQTDKERERERERTMNDRIALAHLESFRDSHTLMAMAIEFAYSSSETEGKKVSAK